MVRVYMRKTFMHHCSFIMVLHFELQKEISIFWNMMSLMLVWQTQEKPYPYKFSSPQCCGCVDQDGDKVDTFIYN